jgi:triphosphatase
MSAEPPGEGARAEHRTAGAARADREVELKLLLDPAQLSRLRRHPSVAALSQGPARTRRLHSVYYDTRELDLLREGLALRVRRVGRAFVQTVKADGSTNAGLFERAEVECPVPQQLPDVERIPDLALRARVRAALAGRPPEPVLETEMRRTQRLLRESDTELHFDLDQGEVRTPRGSLPLCELELELLRGDPRVLYDLALELLDSVPLRVGTRSKFERGLQLLTGERPSPQRSQSVELPGDASVEAALEAVLRASLSQVLANEDPARQGVDPEGVHQMRVGVRRLRSALALFGAVLPEVQIAPLKDDLRWLGGELGPARDLDVFLADTLEPLANHFRDLPELKRLRDEALLLRAESYERVRAAVDSRRYTELVLRLGRFLAARSWRNQALDPDSAQLFQPARERTRPLLARRYKKVRRLGKRLRELTVPEKHALRIQVKKLRYAAEFLRGLHPGKAADKLVQRASRLQDGLGHLNDVATGEQILAQLLTRLGDEAGPRHQRAVGFALGWVARTADHQLQGLPSLWKSFAKVEPFWREGG